MVSIMYAKVITILNRFITLSVYAIYPVVLLLLVYWEDPRVWRVILAPSLSFILVSVFRNVINAPRPYEVKDTVPIINKDTQGKSFPSRHVFSVFVIASTLYFINNPLGLILIGMGCVLAVLRVLGGVHYPRDVIAGAIIGIVSGILGFYF